MDNVNLGDNFSLIRTVGMDSTSLWAGCRFNVPGKIDGANVTVSGNYQITGNYISKIYANNFSKKAESFSQDFFANMTSADHTLFEKLAAVFISSTIDGALKISYNICAIVGNSALAVKYFVKAQSRYYWSEVNDDSKRIFDTYFTASVVQVGMVCANIKEIFRNAIRLLPFGIGHALGTLFFRVNSAFFALETIKSRSENMLIIESNTLKLVRACEEDYWADLFERDAESGKYFSNIGYNRNFYGALERTNHYLNTTVENRLHPQDERNLNRPVLTAEELKEKQREDGFKKFMKNIAAIVREDENAYLSVLES